MKSIQRTVEDMKRILWGLVALCMMFVCLTGAAQAEEMLLEDSILLFSEGDLPEMLHVQTYALQDFSAYVTQGLMKNAASINVADYGLTNDEFKILYQNLVNHSPELFFVTSGYRYSPDSHGIVTKVIPTYKYSGAELERERRDFEASVKKIADFAAQSKSIEGKLLRINDYFCVNYQYDTEYKVYGAEELFKGGKGVCQAYMMACRAVLNELGIANEVATSWNMNHTWNMVQIGADWYHVDITWDDPVPDVPLSVYHNNFLLSDEGIIEARHYDWDAPVIADSKKYDNFFWRVINQYIPMLGDTCYFVDATYKDTMRTIYSYNLSTKARKAIHTYNYGSGTYYPDLNAVWVDEDWIYYGVRHQMYVVPHTGGTGQLLFYMPDDSDWIWYPYAEGNTLRMFVCDTPRGSGKVARWDISNERTLTLNTSLLQMVEGGYAMQLQAQLNPVPSSGYYELAWSSSDPSVAKVNANGVVTAVGPGVAEITVEYAQNSLKANCTVLVHSDDVLYLPEDLEVIGEEAFSGLTVEEICLEDDTEVIGAKAFADCRNLRLIYLPEEVVQIADDAFAGCSSGLVIICHEDSYAAAYAQRKGIESVQLPEDDD